MNESRELPFFGWMECQDYLAHPGISSSFISRFLRSPAHAKYARSTSTASMQIGSILHCAILEPEHFDKRYRVYEGVRNEKHKAYQAWKEEHPGVEAITQAEADKARLAADAVHVNPEISCLLREGKAEQTAIANIDGIACKVRPDWLTTLDGGVAHVSLKTTEDARPWAFGSTALRYNYHLSEYFYSLVLSAVGQHVAHSLTVVIEREYPYCTALYELDEPARLLADETFCKVWPQIEKCFHTGNWPGYKGGVQLLSLPGYAFTEVPR